MLVHIITRGVSVNFLIPHSWKQGNGKQHKLVMLNIDGIGDECKVILKTFAYVCK